jgi:hypothetical protein
MAEIVLKNAFVRIGSSGGLVALSTAVRSVNINYSADLQDKTAMGSSGRARLAGLKDWTVAIEFNQDYATTTIDGDIFSWVGSTGQFIAVRPTSGARAAGNADFIGSLGLIDSYTPINNAVGDLATFSVTWNGADGKSMTRVTGAT